MVRIDKIVYMITCFKPESQTLEQYNYSHPDQNLLLTASSIDMIKRIGVTTKINDTNIILKEFYNHIPYGREHFLIENMNKHSHEICKTKDPDCNLCVIKDHCDYHNNKNDWISV